MGNALNVRARRHWAVLSRAGVIGGILCALPVISYLVVEINPFLILAAVIALIGVVIILRRIELGLVVLLLSGVFVRFRLSTGTGSEIVMSLLLCGMLVGLWLVNMLVVDKRLALKPAPTNVPLLGFMAAVFISLIWGRVFRDVLVRDAGSPFVPVAAAVVMVLLPAAFLLAANLVSSVRWLQVMVWLFIAEGLVSLLLSLIMDLGIGPVNTIRWIIFSNGVVWINTKGLFPMWYLSLAFALALFDRRLHWAWRVALLIYVAGWVYWSFVLRASWLAGWVPAFAAMGVVALMRSKWLCLVVVVVIVVAAGGYYWRTQYESEMEGSGVTRLAAYEVNWRVTGKHLLFGTGPAGYASYYMSYFPMEGMATHSNYIDIVAQTGVVGFFFILWFFGAQILGTYKLRQQLRKREDFAESLAVAVLAGTVGCMVAMALGDWLFPFAYTQGIVAFDEAMYCWFFMGSSWALMHSLTSASSIASTRLATGGVTT